ncbi:hypothetical protein BOTBODRAFT_39143 [Botryobasidium botryosum FD-172 SS1]|uniref:Rho GDP-dissociation inhibitor n=1 Tax=Botryobasidium botryosum (strain FD-172 SS1) TaxID=930990 RepID=A0A067LXE0_BOTB1|nr:hypothetical protein BOTBODRAFT_39143 [Botryobasidium botryosum FD-172 SS1]
MSSASAPQDAVVIDEEELAPTIERGYKPGKETTVEAIVSADSNDESLKRWKESLGITAGTQAFDGPKVEIHSIYLESPTLPEGEKIVIELASLPKDGSTKTIKIKEGVEYSVGIKFKVNNLVMGLRYIQVIKRAGIPMVADKIEEVIGSFGPNPEFNTNRFHSEVSPKGMLARGTYNVKTRVIDDDRVVYADFEWKFTLGKDW